VLLLGDVCGRAFVILFFIAATNHFLPIHREAPAFVEQATEQQILVTGIKVELLCCPSITFEFYNSSQ
jgi:F0F1-type ATP synthase beta subunit